MKAVILAGGLGTRMGDATALRPKPLVEIGGQPIIWHILKMYQAYGVNDFVICAGYAGKRLCEYFARPQEEAWQVRVVDTGEATATGGRLLRIRDMIGKDRFCLTYGDGVANVNITELLEFHEAHRKLVTVTAVRPRLPFGVISFPEDRKGSVGFQEKPRLRDMWVNGGFFVVEPKALDYIQSEDEPWEDGPLTRIARDGELAARKHADFWQCMDAPRDRQLLDDLWRLERAPWKVW